MVKQAVTGIFVIVGSQKVRWYTSANSWPLSTDDKNGCVMWARLGKVDKQIKASV